MKSRFVYMVITIMVVILISPFLRFTGIAGHIFTTLLTALIPLTSFYALTADRKRAIVILIIAAPFVVLDGLSVFFPHPYLMIAAMGFGTVLYLYIIVLLVINLLSYRVITADLIFCAIATYFLIGVMWAGVYMVLEGISPGSFAGLSQNGDLVYFSFVTLTTVGFGDILPQSILAKRLVVFEGALGGIYLAVIIAMIVGRYMSMEEKRELEKEINRNK